MHQKWCNTLLHNCAIHRVSHALVLSKGLVAPESQTTPRRVQPGCRAEPHAGVAYTDGMTKLPQESSQFRDRLLKMLEAEHVEYKRLVSETVA